MKPLFLRALILLLLLTLGYYLFYLLPQAKLRTQATQDLSLLTHIYTPLLQNHLALTQIPLLDPKNPNFAVDQDNLLSLLQTSREQTLATLSNTSRYESLLAATKDLLESQVQLIDQYQPNSPAVTTFISNQNDLLDGYQQEINALKKLLSPPQH